MAVLNVSFRCSKPLPPNPNFSLTSPNPKSHIRISSLSLPAYHSPKELTTQIQVTQNSLGESVAKASFLALLSASLFFSSDPALAFKGGGPYGSEVTRGQDLTGKDFSGKSLIKQDFKTVFKALHIYNLLGASFFDADLTGADLSDTDLRGADFSLVNLTKANLTNATLEGALVTGNTSFKGSIITGADFTEMPLRDDQLAYLCKIADGENPTTGNETRETLLCK